MYKYCKCNEENNKEEKNTDAYALNSIRTASEGGNFHARHEETLDI